MNRPIPFLGTILKIIACTPNNNFNTEEYHQQVILPSRQLRKLYDELGDKEPSKEQFRWAFATLENILTSKKLVAQEKSQLLRDIYTQYSLQSILS